MEPVAMTLDEARTMIEQHFGAKHVPMKHANLLDWWRRLLADPDAPVRMRMACERDLVETFGPIAGRAVVWVMRATP